MNKTVEGKLLDIAAELIVSPITAYVKACEIKEAVAGSETYHKTVEYAKNAGNEVKSAAKKAYENEHVQKGISSVKETAKKVSESEGAQKAKEGLAKVKETAVKFAHSSDEAPEEGCCAPSGEGSCCEADYTEVADEEVSGCCASEEAPQAEGCCAPEVGEENCCSAEEEVKSGSCCAPDAAEDSADCCTQSVPAVSEESIEDVIEAVDLSDIITEEDAKTDIPE